MDEIFYEEELKNFLKIANEKLFINDGMQLYEKRIKEILSRDIIISRKVLF